MRRREDPKLYPMQNQENWRNSIRPRLTETDPGPHLLLRGRYPLLFSRAFARTPRRFALVNPWVNGTGKWQYAPPPVPTTQNYPCAHRCSWDTTQCTEHGERTKDLKRKQMYMRDIYFRKSCNSRNAKVRRTIAHHYRVNGVTLDEFKADVSSSKRSGEIITIEKHSYLTINVKNP